MSVGCLGVGGSSPRMRSIRVASRLVALAVPADIAIIPIFPGAFHLLLPSSSHDAMTELFLLRHSKLGARVKFVGRQLGQIGV